MIIIQTIQLQKNNNYHNNCSIAKADNYYKTVQLQKTNNYYHN
jgi:uncharacterized protein involved in tellurium resistance